MDPLAKKCFKCGVSYSLESYHKRKASKDGLSPYCKQCTRETGRIQYKRHKKKRDAESRNWALKNKSRRREINRKYYEKNKDKENRRKQEYFKTDQGKAARKKAQRNAVERLVDSVIVSRIIQRTNIDKSLITREVIDSYRLLAKIRRAIRDKEYSGTSE